MLITTVTSTLLLEKLHDADADDAWREFDARYRPIICGLARRVGFGAEEAADAAQETLTRFFPAYRAGKYDRTRGRLRSWLLGIARHVLADLIAEKQRRKNWRGESVVGQLPDDGEMNTIWESQRRAAILQKALVQLRDSSKTGEQTIRAFEMVALSRRDPQEVAEELGMTRHDVYVAKHRVTERLRGIVTQIDEMYDGEE